MRDTQGQAGMQTPERLFGSSHLGTKPAGLSPSDPGWRFYFQLRTLTPRLESPWCPASPESTFWPPGPVCTDVGFRAPRFRCWQAAGDPWLPVKAMNHQPQSRHRGTRRATIGRLLRPGSEQHQPRCKKVHESLHTRWLQARRHHGLDGQARHGPLGQHLHQSPL